MPIKFKRYVKSQELVTFFEIKHRLSAYDFVNILARYADANGMIIGDESANPDPLTKKSAEEYIRDALYSYGNSAPWDWTDAYADYEQDHVNRCFEWARSEAIRLWPMLVDDFQKVAR